ncbi:branched-chain amino acid ABC transporter permease [Conexibacter sp. S30A1]|uniref:branched-chain amino acid ABC transporter permease n=1 Tax=Conexibacter sp. S30A1 TaxID=2937800 RepID=UPI00200E4A48|nr:branched-chain amino acid ABC transporter permease [Conexibacter sp. S30A1]
MATLLSLAVGGLADGALYALIAIGFALVFGMTGIFHVAEGGVFLVSAYTYYELAVEAGVPVVIAIIAAAAGALIAGAAIYLLVYQRMLKGNRSFFSIFLASFGTLVVLQNGLVLAFGASPVAFPGTLLQGFSVAGVEITWADVVAIAAAVATTATMAWFLRMTLTGVRLRALAENPQLTSECGIPSSKYRILAYALGCVLVVPGAIILGYTQGIEPSDAPTIVTIAIVASIGGGVGSLVGSGLTALGFGFIASVAVYWLPGSWSEAVAYMAFFVLILVRPSGLFERAR